MLRFLAQFLVALFLTVTAATAQEPGQSAADPALARSSVELLIDVIEDDAARTELVERLRAAGLPDEAESVVPTDPPPEDLSFGRRVALVTQAAAEDFADWTTSLARQIARAPAGLDGLSGGEAAVLIDALAELALARTILLFLASAVTDAMIVLIAWAAGYALAILALGEFGQIGIRQTLYLNAFLLVEMAKVAVRLVLSPSATALRPLPIPDRAASYLSTRINLIVGIVGYGQLLIVPILNSNVSFAAGRATSALIAMAVLMLAIGLVLRNRRTVSDWLLGPQTEDATSPC